MGTYLGVNEVEWATPSGRRRRRRRRLQLLARDYDCNPNPYQVYPWAYQCPSVTIQPVSFSGIS
jgi:hypothetical protein